MNKNYIKKLLSYHKWKYLGSVLFSLASGLFTVAPYFVVYDILQHMMEKDRSIALYLPLLGKLFFCFVLANSCHKVSTALSHSATFDLLGHIRRDLKEKLWRLPLGVVDDLGVGYLKTVFVEKVDSMETPFAHIVPEATGNILTTVFTLLYLFYLDWRLALAAVFVIAVGVLCYVSGMGKFAQRYENYLQKNAQLNNAIVEYIGGIEVIKAFNQSAGAYGKLKKAVYDAAHAAIDWMETTVWGFSICFVLVPATLVGVIPLGIFFYLNESLSFSSFILIMLVNFGAMLPLLQAASHMDNVTVAFTNLKGIAQILEMEELQRPKEFKSVLKNLDISFRNVSFSYGEKEVLHGVSLDMPQNGVYALVGPSGSGKSTITKLISSFYEVNSGEITFGGTNVKDIPFEVFHRYISYVSQKDYLFNTTIMENLKMGDPKKTEEEIKEICKKCGVDGLIQGLEQGYDTVVGSFGGHLSGGERQRISIARAMVKNAPIVIFDEATAYTDPENEALIQQSVSSLIQGKTLIVVAHRLSTITQADKIFVIDQGRVAGSGSHKELLEHCPLYKKMYQTHMEYKDEKVSA